MSKLYKISYANLYAQIYCGTFTFGYYINRHEIVQVENSDNFSSFFSIGTDGNWYSSKNKLIITNIRESRLGIYINGVPIHSKEERIKILAKELLFHKRRKQLTKIARAYKERKKQRILTATEKYIPIDLGKIVESYVQKMDPINCRFRKN